MIYDILCKLYICNMIFMILIHMIIGSRWDSGFPCSPGSLCPESAWVRSTWKRPSRPWLRIIQSRVRCMSPKGCLNSDGCLEKGHFGWHFDDSRGFHFKVVLLTFHRYFFNFSLFRSFQDLPLFINVRNISLHLLQTSLEWVELIPWIVFNRLPIPNLFSNWIET